MANRSPQPPPDAGGAAPHPPRRAYPRYRAPTAGGAALVDPPAGGLLGLIEKNRSRPRIGPVGAEAAGPWAPLLRAARRELLRIAWEHTRQYCDTPKPTPAAADGPIILSGHQPELFHPGVWFKNFALDRLAKAAGGVGVHVLIDSDLCRAHGVWCPAGEPASPRVAAIPYDGSQPPIPWEERAVSDRSVLRSFGRRIASTLEGMIAQPLATRMQPHLDAAAAQTGNLGEVLSRTRRIIEASWGVRTLEAPLSKLCGSEAFASFARSTIASLGEFRSAYNAALADYRAAHRLRSPAQPLPDLAEHDGWIEAPLWVWTRDDPTRRAVFAKASPGGVRLADRSGAEWPLEALAGGQPAVRFRSRALLTTLYARLVLGDLFLHGIGGAKYDQVTDGVSRRLFGAAPPPHATLSATLRLPIEPAPGDPAELAARDAQLRQQLRQLRYHPERFIASPTGEAVQRVAEKQVAIAAARKLGIDAARHGRIDRANLALQPLLADRRESIERRLGELAQQASTARVLGSREYSFCLFPEDWLREQMATLSAKLPP